MLERFLEHKDSVNLFLDDHPGFLNKLSSTVDNITPNLSEEEYDNESEEEIQSEEECPINGDGITEYQWKSLEKIIDVLKLVKITISRLSQRQITISHYLLSYRLMIKQLSQTEGHYKLASEVSTQLKNRVEDVNNDINLLIPIFLDPTVTLGLSESEKNDVYKRIVIEILDIINGSDDKTIEDDESNTSGKDIYSILLEEPVPKKRKIQKKHSPLTDDVLVREVSKIIRA